MPEDRFALEEKLTAWHLGIALGALFLGTWFGPLQVLEHAGVDLYGVLAPGIQSYYQGLTLHGVLNALVFTTFFIVGFLTFTTVYSLKTSLRFPRLNAAGLWLMAGGLVLAAAPLLLNDATVLYTFYPPLKASALFYIGLTLVVVGSWVEGFGLYFTLGAWRAAHPGVRTPFIAFGSVLTMAMWQIASLGIAAEMLALLIPWSLGWVRGTDPLLARTLFWFTGHPIVYFWLLPAYVSWYGMLPRQAGGKVFSDPLARLAFWLFLVLSIPVGFHHQFADPGISPVWKAFHALLTYAVSFPSLLTAFTVIASLELGGRARGGTGLFGWVSKLPWRDPSFTAQALAIVTFALGGIGGIINASYNVDLIVHNTLWIVGHFHLTLATAVVLSFIGISYWLVPRLAGRELWSPRTALVQAWLWVAGMAPFSISHHLLGFRFGVPRRTMLGAAPYLAPEWNPLLVVAAIGGVLLWTSVVLYFIVILGTVLASRRVANPAEMPVAEAVRDVQETPAWLDAWRPWLIATVILIVLSYGWPLAELVRNAELSAPGMRVW
ncbi:MAG TPA: cbb3-type cytochrome c oxidase subunit I [candidate division Zixibacteria bacterium]|nr:cbb3-type cytochrome c oxidase subunit I [candidate division Zixibacteria bacterium]